MKFNEVIVFYQIVEVRLSKTISISFQYIILCVAFVALSISSYFISLTTICTTPSAFSIVLTIVPIEPIISLLALVPLVLTITTVGEAFAEPPTTN